MDTPILWNGTERNHRKRKILDPRDSIPIHLPEWVAACSEGQKKPILCHQTVCPFDDQLIRDRWSLKSENLFILNSWKLHSLILSKLRMADILHNLQAHGSISNEGSLVVSYLCWRMSPFILAVHSNDRYQVPNKPPDWSISTSILFSHCHNFQSKNKIREIGNPRSNSPYCGCFPVSLSL